jgi:diguanylate cyclase (GGDEF)-like protein
VIDDLNSLVARSAQKLGHALADETVEISEEILADVAQFLSLDVAALRHNDHHMRATILVAQWPPHANATDQRGVVYFSNADPLIAAAEHLEESMVVDLDPEADESPARILEGTDVSKLSVALVPLKAARGTVVGTLELIKYGERQWSAEELQALQTIAYVFAHVKTRADTQDEIRRLGLQDDLTCLWNRRKLLGHLEMRLAAGSPAPVAVLFISLDRLNAVSDYLGREAGDQLLIQMADKLQDYVGNAALVARTGDDEIVVVLEDPATRDEAEAFARRLRSALNGRYTVGHERVACSISIGLAVGVPGKHSVSDLMSRAEHALAGVKGLGGNDIAVFRDELADTFAMRTDIFVHLHRAAEGDGIQLQYQPEVDLHTGAVVAVESLLRWNHPARGLLSPEQFMPVAEETNQAAALGRRALLLACRQLSEWRQEGLAADIVVRVKVPPAMVLAESFVGHLRGTLDALELTGDSLSLEFSESALLYEAEVGEVLRGLRAAGVGLALDGFGTGYGPLKGLKSLPIDTIKIDSSFVQLLTEDLGNIAIVRSLAVLCDQFGLDLVADGLQVPIDARALLALGCRRAQGPFVSGPLDRDDMTELLAGKYVSHIGLASKGLPIRNR